MTTELKGRTQTPAALAGGVVQPSPVRGRVPTPTVVSGGVS